MTQAKYILGTVGLAASVFASSALFGRSVSAQTQPPAAGANPVASMPDAPGKDITVKTCSVCHAVTNMTSQHRDADTWTATVTKMVGYGATGSDEELQQIVDYLTKYYGPASAAGAGATAGHAKVMVNKETATQLTTDLGLTDDEAKAVVSYREKNGDFKSVDDLKKVPNVDAKKIDAHAADLQFS